ncbi:uncharacterized protein LOC128218245 isoform X4 [Mya arenaria]|uniref:uncharacterized protein LOC128218245 isoform X4 n=1 Tax=Mya arenaria TaxID=6604 RepID=UPI0022E76E12|nr:uncharacterized protein LOC128218245 isoform X4 [Mya arenaria]
MSSKFSSGTDVFINELIFLVLIYFTAPVSADQRCSYLDTFGKIKYRSCESGCCGTVHHAYCCVHRQFGLIVLGGVLGFFIFVCIIAVLIHCWFVHRRRHQYNVIVTDMGNNQPAGRVEDDVQPYYQDDVQPYDPYPAGEVDVNVDIQPYNPAGQVEPDIQPYQPQDLQPYQPEPDVQPYGGDTQPYGGDTRPYQDTQPYGGDTQPYGGDTQPYGGDTQPYGGDTQPYGGNTQPYGGDTQPYGGDTQPYGGDTQPYGGDTQPYDPSRAGIADYPDTDPYPSEPAGYADDDDH